VNIYRKKASESTPNIYLGLVSIIQSVVLGYFADKIELNFDSAWDFSIRMLMYGIILQMIVITWHEYVLSTICFSWPIGFSDTWIPILLGLAEYMVVKCTVPQDLTINYIKSPFVLRFWLALTVFISLALVAFLNRDRKMRQARENQAAVSALEPSLRKTKRWMCVAFLGYIAGAVISWLRLTAWPALVALTLANISFSAQAILCRNTYRSIFGEPHDAPCNI
jgi:hypothetical protein